MLLKNEGISETLKQAFLVYLISHPRPVEELLNPNWKDISEIYQNEFLGMTRQEITLKELELAAKNALSSLLAGFTENEKELLFSIYSEHPNWDCLPFEHLQELPAIKWKLLNISKMTTQKRRDSIRALKEIFSKC